jgi:hypothetical protein
VIFISPFLDFANIFRIFRYKKGNMYKLVRKHDKLTKTSDKIFWLEFNENGSFKSKHDEPLLNRSLIMSPFNPNFTWQCTVITELIEQRDDYIHFKTKNSEYELFKLGEEMNNMLNNVFENL